jgi:hypothetical protein
LEAGKRRFGAGKLDASGGRHNQVQGAAPTGSGLGRYLQRVIFIFDPLKLSEAFKLPAICTVLFVKLFRSKASGIFSTITIPIVTVKRSADIAFSVVDYIGFLFWNVAHVPPAFSDLRD